ncbi:MAG: hypothetical protein GTN73_01240 [Candidatus Aminicenantes bacterium]|nr:hypothetical protein [Candidatus Aminicenantes bacterium]
MEKEKILISWLVMVFFLNIGLFGGPTKFPAEKLEKAEQLQREIRLLNLINGLDLTQEQMEMILRSAEESKKLRERFIATLLYQQDKMEESLKEIKSYLGERKEIPPDVVQNYRRLDKEIKKARLEMQESVRDLARQIEEGLESHQIFQLQEFIPCIIPPKGEARIGQASNYKGQIRSLERIRRIPSRLYQTRKEEILSRTLEAMKIHVPLWVDIDEEEMKSHIQAVYDETRRLDDPEFEIQKKRLAEDLISPFKPDIPAHNLARKIEGFLLSPEIIPILEERIKVDGSNARQVP